MFPFILAPGRFNPILHVFPTHFISDDVIIFSVWAPFQALCINALHPKPVFRVQAFSLEFRQPHENKAIGAQSMQPMHSAYVVSAQIM